MTETLMIYLIKAEPLGYSSSVIVSITLLVGVALLVISA